MAARTGYLGANSWWVFKEVCRPPMHGFISNNSYKGLMEANTNYFCARIIATLEGWLTDGWFAPRMWVT
jgi:hypothetical protein